MMGTMAMMMMGKDKGFKGYGKVVTVKMQREWAEEEAKMGASAPGPYFGATGKGKGKRKDNSFKGGKGPQGTEDDAIREIHAQLSKPPFNRVFIDDWRDRFGGLAPNYKEFMLSRPDLFELTFQGSRYEVAWIGGDPFGEPELLIAAPKKMPAPDLKPKGSIGLNSKGAGGFNSKGAAGMGPKGGKPRRADPVVDSVPATEFQGTEEEALFEILEQLKDPKNKQNKVFITDWRERYGHLAKSYRKFMEDHPERFIVIPGKGASYTVELMPDVMDEDEINFRSEEAFDEIAG